MILQGKKAKIPYEIFYFKGNVFFYFDRANPAKSLDKYHLFTPDFDPFPKKFGTSKKNLTMSI